MDQLVSIDDPTRTLSKTHLRAEWHNSELWIIDHGSGNGTIVQRGDTAPTHLIPGEPYQLVHGDVVRIGEVTFTATLEHSGQTENER